MLKGKAREMGLGAVHTITLTEARDRATECRKLLMAGHDPIEVRNSATAAKLLQEATALTFKQCAEEYIKTHKAGWKNAKHITQWENTLRDYAYPTIGDLPVDAVDTDLILKCLSPIWNKKTETATRVRGRIESILDWATAKKYRKGDNPGRWQGLLENLLAAPNKLANVKHHPALPYAQASSFMSALRLREGIAARAVEFAILTAARSGEVRGALWSEIDLDKALWEIPAERMKMEKEHRVPLSKAAVALLKDMPRIGQLVFPGAKKDSALSDMSLTAVLRRMNEGSEQTKPNRWVDEKGSGITVHGFRSTFRDWAAEISAYLPEVAEMALAHAVGDKVEAAYRRGDLFVKRREMMEDWSTYCVSR
jgi:integrase